MLSIPFFISNFDRVWMQDSSQANQAKKSATGNHVAYLVRISYIGHRYNGYQPQPHQLESRCIQNVVLDAFLKVYDEVFVFSGTRTDSKIHSRDHAVVVRIGVPISWTYPKETVKIANKKIQDSRAIDQDIQDTMLHADVVKALVNQVLMTDREDVSVNAVEYMSESFVYNRFVVSKVYNYVIIDGLLDDMEEVYIRQACALRL